MSITYLFGEIEEIKNPIISEIPLTELITRIKANSKIIRDRNGDPSQQKGFIWHKDMTLYVGTSSYQEASNVVQNELGPGNDLGSSVVGGAHLLYFGLLTDTKPPQTGIVNYCHGSLVGCLDLNVRSNPERRMLRK